MYKYSAPFVDKAVFFSKICFWHLYLESTEDAWIDFWGFLCNSQVYESIHMPLDVSLLLLLLVYLIFFTKDLYYILKLGIVTTSALFVLLRIALSIWVVCVFPYEF
jgi:hypothetical protein